MRGGTGWVQPLDNGGSLVRYRAAAGKYMLSVTDGDGAHVHGSPFPLTVLPSLKAPCLELRGGEGT